MSAHHDPRTGIRITYDPPADTLRIQFQKNGAASTCRYPAPTIAVALDDRRRIVHIEIRGASRHVRRSALDAFVVAEEYITIKEAAAITGHSPVMLRQRIRCAHLQATKRGRDWFIHRRHLEEFLAGPRCREWDVL